MTNEIPVIGLQLKISKQISQKIDIKRRYHFQVVSIIFLRAK